MTSVKVCTLANLILFFLKISTCRGFLFDDVPLLSTLCFPQDQFCSCNMSHTGEERVEVTCSAKQLTNVPNFTKISDQIIGHYNYWSINLTDNQLTTIPSGIFSNFNLSNKIGNSMYLNFERNKISRIENDAFVGINIMEVYINLTDNLIAAIPLAFQSLKYLTSLAIQGNPILTFDSAIIKLVAKSLTVLELDFNALLSGNEELSILNLTVMKIYNIPSDIENTTTNPFLFFRNSMTDMGILGTGLTTLPCILIDGHNMDHFYIKDARNIIANSVFDCRLGTRLSVVDLEITYSDLEEFPDILKFTTSLLALNLFNNKISSINEKFIPLHNTLEWLNLSNNRLQTIPASFSRFNHLKFLYMEHNLITSVAPEFNVMSLKSVCATGNPWTHGGIHCYIH